MKFFKKLNYYVEKILDGSLGDGVSYNKSEELSAKGTELEQKITTFAENENFKVYRNLYIPFNSKGTIKYTEIDVLLVSENKIFVVESKNYKAKIVGSINDNEFIAKYNNGKSFNFYSPIKQNNTHIWALSKYLGISEDKLSSLIVFSDGASIESLNIPHIINLKTLRQYININGNINNFNLIDLDKKLSKLKSNRNIKIQHRKNINNKK